MIQVEKNKNEDWLKTNKNVEIRIETPLYVAEALENKVKQIRSLGILPIYLR